MAERQRAALSETPRFGDVTHFDPGEAEPMKRFLSITAAVLAIGVTPAQAMDYVKCEAMNKAAGRIRVTAEEVRDTERDAYRAQKLDDLCGDNSKCKRDNWRHGWNEGLEAGEKAAAVQLARLEQIQKDYQAEGCY